MDKSRRGRVNQFSCVPTSINWQYCLDYCVDKTLALLPDLEEESCDVCAGHGRRGPWSLLMCLPLLDKAPFNTWRRPLFLLRTRGRRDLCIQRSRWPWNMSPAAAGHRDGSNGRLQSSQGNASGQGHGHELASQSVGSGGLGSR